MPQRVLALEVDAHELKAAVVETTFRDYRVVAFYREPVDAADGTLSEQVRAFLQHNKLEARTVLSSLPGDLVALRTLFLPFRDRKQLDQTVPNEIETQVPFDLEDIVVDYQVLHRDKSGSSILAAVVQRRDLEEHLRILKDAGLDPKVVDLAPLAALNVLTLVGANLPQTCAYVGGDSRRLVVAMYRNRQLLGLRTVVPPAPLNAEEAEAGAAGNGDASGEMAPFASLIEEVRWSLLAINGASLDADLPCFVAGDGVQFDALAAQLAGGLAFDVRRLDQAPLRNIPEVLRAQVPSFVSPLGLALREVAPNDALGVNFRRGEFAYHRGQEELQRALWRSGSLAAVVVVLFLLNMYMDHARLANQLAMIQAQIRDVFTQTLPDVKHITDEKTQLEAEIEDAKKQLELLSGIAPVGGATAIDALRTISAAVPDALKIDIDEYVMDPEGVRIRAKTDSFESVDAIKQRVADAHYFGDVQVKDVKSTPEGKAEFRMLLTLSKDAGGAAPKP
jgi:general secretion pathway protein L